MARKAGLSAISITDHDSIEGVKQIGADNGSEPPRFLTGVEISTAPPSGYRLPGSLHLLGYGFDPSDAGLNRALKRLQAARARRNPEILERLSALGIDLPQTALAADGGGQTGRPHIARAMVRCGFAESIDDAFDRFLGTGKPAYVDKYRIPCAEAVHTIQAAGGLAVLAHPFLLQPLDIDTLFRLVADLKTLGMDGIEVFYPEHSREQTEVGLELANRFDLLVTGGTDFHGDPTSDIEIGSGAGDFFVPISVYNALAAALKTTTESGADFGPLPQLEQRLSYLFEDRLLLEEALSHSSFVHEQENPAMRSNERLEFLGDAVLNLAAGHLLMARFEDIPEGPLSRMRAHLVNESQVANLARRLDLGRYLRLGKGERRSGGPEKRSILADAYEALIGAIYLDGGFGAAFQILQSHLKPLLAKLSAPAESADYKSRLQETAQGQLGEVPAYRMVGESGPDHDKTFRVEVCVADICEEGTGKSKKTAEQDAARKALNRFCSDDPPATAS